MPVRRTGPRRSLAARLPTSNFTAADARRMPDDLLASVLRDLREAMDARETWPGHAADPKYRQYERDYMTLHAERMSRSGHDFDTRPLTSWTTGQRLTFGRGRK